MLYKCGKLVDHNQAMLKILGVFFLQKREKNTTALCHNQLIIQMKSFFDPLSEYQYTVSFKCLYSFLPACLQILVLEFSSDKQENQARKSGADASGWKVGYTGRQLIVGPKYRDTTIHNPVVTSSPILSLESER